MIQKHQIRKRESSHIADRRILSPEGARGECSMVPSQLTTKLER